MQENPNKVAVTTAIFELVAYEAFVWSWKDRKIAL